jgi:hypothetical protein
MAGRVGLVTLATESMVFYLWRCTVCGDGDACDDLMHRKQHQAEAQAHVETTGHPVTTTSGACTRLTPAEGNGHG